MAAMTYQDTLLKSILEKKEQFLRRHLVLSSSVVDMLRKEEVIGQYTYKQMQANRSNSNKQMSLLIVCLKARGLQTFHKFLEVLRQTFHGWIADDLLESTVDVPNKSISGKVKDLVTSYPEQEINYGETHNPSYHGNPRAHHTYPSTYKQPIPTQYYFHNGLLFPTHPSWIRSPDDQMFPRGSFYGYGIRHKGRDSPITQVPENLRELQRTLDDEATTAKRNLTTLKQEEVTIKALLQQNMRQQQDLHAKQKALTEASGKIQQIKDSTSNLLKPELDADMRQTRKRLSALKRVPWNV